MKILFVGNGLLRPDNYPTPDAGGSVQTWGLSKELAKRGNDVYIVRRSNRKEEKIQGVNLVSVTFKCIEGAMPTYSYPSVIAFLMLKIYFSKKSLGKILRVNPDVICLIDKYSGFFPAGLNLPKVYIMHVPEALGFFRAYAIHANKLNSVMFYIKKTVETSVMRRADKIVALNGYIEEYLKRNGFSNVVNIPNGINPQQFTKKGDENYILYAGRFDWNKNVCSLIKAFAELPDSYNDYRLYLVGEGPEERRIKRLVKNNVLQSHVVIFPWLPRKKLMNIMSKCSVFVLPSLFEVNSVAVLEAMASGKPVIARTNIGTADIIIHGKNGYLYNNKEELEKYLELLLSDNSLKKKIGRNARRTVEEKYTFSKIADSYEKLYRSLLVE